MPPKKITWGDIPNSEFVKIKDEVNGRWIGCSLCDVVIKVRATYGVNEWVNHCSSSKHSQLVTSKHGPGGMHKLTTYFDINKDENKSTVSLKARPSKKSKLINPCPGFNYCKNPELLQLYNKYKKRDTLNDSIFIHCRKVFGVLTHHNVQMWQ